MTISADVQLLIAVPTMGSVHPILASRLIQWGRQLPEGQVHFYFTFKVAPVDRARNQVVSYFLSKEIGPEKKKFTHLLFIDSDTIPPVDAVERLFSHGKAIVSGLTPILTYDDDKGWSTYDNCFSHVERKDGQEPKTFITARNTGLQKIFRCGASCLLIAREVFEHMKPPYFEFISNAENTEHIRSEDINFCEVARSLDYEIFADTDVVCQHYKDIML